MEFTQTKPESNYADELMGIGLSSAGEFHPRALQEPYVTVSCHTAPTVQPTAENQIPKTQIVQVHGVQCDLTSGSL